MKEVVIHPERCVGCMQCMIACATAHSKTKSLLTALAESPLPKPRIHVGVGLYREGFPNRCRHCDPAPCMMVCLPGAIYRDETMNTVLINTERCINCATCAMACPFGVIRYHEDSVGPPGKIIAVKCDNCVDRQSRGLAPACVEVCKCGALTFEEQSSSLKRKTDEMAKRVSSGAEERGLSESPGFDLLNVLKKANVELSGREATL
jgi:carbon-monoxide dehydrogenase iron sulfur subunit